MGHGPYFFSNQSFTNISRQGLVQTSLFSCAEPNSRIKYTRDATFESIWYGNLVRSGRLVWIGRACRAARSYGTVSSVELVMYRTQCLIIFNLFSFTEFISFLEGACVSNKYLRLCALTKILHVTHLARHD